MDNKKLKGSIQVVTMIIINMILIIFLIKSFFNPDKATWLSLFASFCSVFAGVLTLVGVRMTIQNAENVRRQNEYPGKINNLEILIHKLDGVLKELESFTWVREPYDTTTNDDLRLHHISPYLEIIPSRRMENIIDALFLDIKENILSIDARWYKDYFELRDKVSNLRLNFVSGDYGLTKLCHDAQEYYMHNFEPMMSWRDYAINYRNDEYEQICKLVINNELRLIHDLYETLAEYKNLAELYQLNLLKVIE